MNQRELDEKITEASKVILTYCISHTSSYCDAEDLSQEILCEIIKSSTNLRDDSAFYGFMWSVARNVYRQWYRKKLSVNECELTDEIAECAGWLDVDFDEKTDVQCLRRELTLLAEKYRRAVILYYIENKSCLEIAQILSVSESMVKYLLFKSRKILKEGMLMERRFGELSYNPRKLIPMYSGEGPNCFYSFMDNLLRQNIVLACYNDSLTAEQISLETGLPLPYLDDNIREMTEREVLLQTGRRYLANIVIVNRECSEDICRKVLAEYDTIANLIIEFVDSYMEKYVKMGFYGADFSENALRW